MPEGKPLGRFPQGSSCSADSATICLTCTSQWLPSGVIYDGSSSSNVYYMHGRDVKVDTVCPWAGYRRIAFHSRGCVEPLRSEEEERVVRMLVCKHLTYKYIGVPYPIPWKIPYVPYKPTKVTPLSKFPLVTQ
jgi:hypothetical protein